LSGDVGVALAHGGKLRAPGVILLFGEQHQLQQRIGDAAAGRQHHGDALRRLRLDDRGDAREAVRVRYARATKFMDDPGTGISGTHDLGTFDG